VRKIITPLLAATVLACTAITSAGAAPARDSVTLNGAGSTFDGPFFTKAFEAYKGQFGTSINYQLIGSGGGIKAFTAKTVDFGATDVPLNPTSELPAAVSAGGPVVQLPITIGGVSIVYNVAGVKNGLHLTGPVLAQIYLGSIKTWNDKAIKALNKGVKLPSSNITVVHRADSSGTSYIFCDYLAQVSAQWRGIVGVNKLPAWPTGVGGTGTPGVAQLVQSTPNTIGYVEQAYAIQNKMKQAMLQNRAKEYQFPTQKTVAASAAKFPKVSATEFSIVNAPGKGTYPIAGYSWVLLFQHQTDSTKGKDLKKLFTWMIGTGQKYAKQLDYVVLPKNIVKLATSLLKKITY
jgi:phosphate transport system substrate-binding protein